MSLGAGGSVALLLGSLCNDEDNKHRLELGRRHVGEAKGLVQLRIVLVDDGGDDVQETSLYVAEGAFGGFDVYYDSSRLKIQSSQITNRILNLIILVLELRKKCNLRTFFP